MCKLVVVQLHRGRKAECEWGWRGSLESLVPDDPGGAQLSVCKRRGKGGNMSRKAEGVGIDTESPGQVVDERGFARNENWAETNGWPKTTASDTIRQYVSMRWIELSQLLEYRRLGTYRC